MRMGIPRRRRREHNHEEYAKVLGLITLNENLSIKLHILTAACLLLIFFIFLGILMNGWTPENRNFIISQYFNLSLLIFSLRIWWIYGWKKTESAMTISIKIVISSVFQLLSSAASLITIYFMHSVNSAENQSVSTFLFFLTYFSVAFTLIVNLLNCIKLISLIVIFARQSHQEQMESDSRRDISRDLSLEVRDLEEGISNFDERAQMIIDQISASRQQMQRENDESSVELFEARERRHRRRRILRHLRSRGVQEGTIQAIRHILEASLERNSSDTPEERVKIYSRIEGVLYDNEKHGESESCPICFEEYEDKCKLKILPDCSHVFHENWIEQWILKARSSWVSCPVCREEILAKLPEESKETENEESEEMVRLRPDIEDSESSLT